MDENRERGETSQNLKLKQGSESKKLNSTKIFKFEDRMMSICVGEFQIKDNDFPSLSNEMSKPLVLAEGQEAKSPVVSYSEKVSKPKMDPKLTKIEIREPVCNEIQETKIVVQRKKRKRSKKKKSDSNLPKLEDKKPDENVHINLEDLVEYPTLNTSVKAPMVKSVSVATKSEKSTTKVKKPEIPKENIPGVLTISATVIKNQTKTTGKKSKTPVEINIFDVIIKPKKQAEIKAKKLNPTFNVKKGKFNNINKVSPHNVLDSTAPVRKRGKERENPKKAKLSKLKKIILYERAIRKELQTQSVIENIQNIPPNELLSKTLEEIPKTVKAIEENEIKVAIVDEIDVKNVDNEVPKVKIMELPPESLETEKNENIFVIPTIEDNKEQREILFCIKKVVHSRKYRDYCYQRISQEIDSNLEQLLQDLVRFQDRQFQKDPVKAKIKKRMVFGLKEVTKNLKINKIKFVIIAPDVERILSEGGLNDAISNLIQSCNDHKIPIVFGLPRRKLGFICKKSVPLSCIGVISYEGKEELYKILMDLVMEARESYESLVKQIEKIITPEIKDILTNSETNDKKLQEIKRNIFSQLECLK